MRKIIYIAIAIIGILSLSGCQSAAKHWGGDITVDLDPGVKLEEITWKDDDLWYLTRPMREDEEPETHLFQQSTDWGVFEGTVTVVESKKEG